jgi:hypothetical protein
MAKNPQNKLMVFYIVTMKLEKEWLLEVHQTQWQKIMNCHMPKLKKPCFGLLNVHVTKKNSI